MCVCVWGVEGEINFWTQKYKGIFQKHKQGSLSQGEMSKVVNLQQPGKKARPTIHEPSLLYLPN